MHITSVLTAAGSSGKSTTVATLASLLAGRGRSVCVVDADPQADASTWFGITDPDAPSMTSVLLGRVGIDDALRTAHGVHVLPASGLDMTTELTELRSRSHLLGALPQRLAASTVLAPDTIVLVDCPGIISDTATVVGALAATTVVSCTYPGAKEAKGLADVAGLVAECPAGRIAGIVPCAVMPSSRHAGAQEHLARISQEWPGVTTPPVRWSKLVDGAYTAQTPLPVVFPTAAVTRDYAAALDALVTMGALPA